MSFRKAKCAGCGADIVWATITRQDGTPGRVPLDPRPPIFHVTPEGEGNAAGVLIKPDADGTTSMVSHFATCPKASAFSGSRRAVVVEGHELQPPRAAPSGRAPAPPSTPPHRPRFA